MFCSLLRHEENRGYRLSRGEKKEGEGLKVYTGELDGSALPNALLLAQLNVSSVRSIYNRVTEMAFE